MNVFAFAGNITKDPEIKTTQSGKQVTSFSVAINEGKDNTLFINCVAWERTAELISQYCKKGDRLSGSGRLDIRQYEKDGEKRYATEIIVNQFDFPPKREGESKPQEKSAPVEDQFDDDIPF